VRKVPSVDAAWTAHVADLCARQYADFTIIPADELTQIDYVLAADSALDCACVTYALGAEPDDVRIWLSRAAYLLGQVFALRGTTPPITVTVIDEVGERRDGTPWGPDQSLTNSRRGLLAMQTALIAGDQELAEQTAKMVGDPPNASYVGPESEVCTPDDQVIAYAFKAFLLGQTAVAVFHLGGITEGALPVIRHQAAAIAMLIDRDEDAFLRVLDRLLRAHAAEAAKSENAREPRRFLCLSAIALARLGIDRGQVSHDLLPESSIYLPLDLLV
jgi:hypothetical protein